MRLAHLTERVIDNARRAFLAKGAVVERHSIGKNFTEQQATNCGHHALVGAHFLRGLRLIHHNFAEAIQAHFNPSVVIQRASFPSQNSFIWAEEVGDLGQTLALFIANGAVALNESIKRRWRFFKRASEEVHTHDDVLRRADDWVSVGWTEDVVR